MILEGIVTTVDASGRLNIAPMGPIVEPGFDRFILRPFKTSTTFVNLQQNGEGVLHVTDDVLLMTRSALGAIDDAATRPAERVHGRVLLEACRYFEFRIEEVDDREERATLRAVTLHRGWFRDFFGFNRARHAVIEGAILATRVHLLPRSEIESDLERLQVLVDKTGGPVEHEAFALIRNHIRTANHS